MKVRQILSWLGIFCLVLFFAAEAVIVNPDHEQNSLRANYSFENEDGERPVGWFTADPNVKFNYIKDGVPGVNTHSGTHAISMSDPTDNNGRWYNDKDAEFAFGEELIFSFWFKTENFSEGTSMSTVIEWQEKGVAGRGVYWGSSVKVNTDWTKYEVLLKAPGDANFAVIQIKLENEGGGEGTVYIDDLYFGPYSKASLGGQIRDSNPNVSALLSDATVTLFNPTSIDLDDRNIKFETKTDQNGQFVFDQLPEGEYNLVVEKTGFRPLSEIITIEGHKTYDLSLVATGFGENLVPNANLEKRAGTERPDFWYFASGEPIEYIYLDGGTPGETTFSGIHAIAMKDPAGKNGRWFIEGIDAAAIAGEEVALAFWLKTQDFENGMSFFPVIEWPGSDPSYLPSVKVNQEWNYYVSKVRVPENAEVGVITLKLENDDGNGKGTVYIDDLFLGLVEDLALKNVTLDRNLFSPKLDQKLTIDYGVSMSANLILEVLDSQGTIIDEMKKGPLIGASQFIWDGKDEDGQLFPDGAYTLRLKATDGEQEVSKRFEVEIDCTGPQEVEILDPLPEPEMEFVVHNLEKINLTIKTDQPEALVEVFRGEELVGSGTADSTGKVGSLTVSLIEGENQLTVVAYDQLENPSELTPELIVKYDPSLALGIIEITNGDFFSPKNKGEQLTVSFYVKEEADVSFEIFAADQLIYSYQEEISEDTNLVLEWNGQDQEGLWVADGEYIYKLEVKFKTGDLGSRTGNVTVDNSPPVAPRQQYPSSKATLTSLRPELKWEKVQDAKQYLVIYSDNEQFIDGKLISTTRGEYKIEQTLAEGEYFWKVRAVDVAGNESDWSDVWSFKITALESDTFDLVNFTVYPNPFNPTGNGIMDQLAIGFTLQQPGTVRMVVYNLAGQVVRKRDLGEFAEGDSLITWDGKNQQGQRVKKGTYILQLTAENPNYSAIAEAVRHILVLY